jgi:photosystem II stability/assembly factor-like uncharacterized protein
VSTASHTPVQTPEGAAPGGDDKREATVRSRARTAFLGLPLRFEPDTQPGIDSSTFVARGSGYALAVSRSGMAIAVRPRSTDRAATITMRLVGSSSRSVVTARHELPGVTNYFEGGDPKAWRTNIRGYSQVDYRDVYPGIDVVYYGNQQKLEYDFRIAPGVRPSTIAMAFEGAVKPKVDTAGNLVISGTGGTLIQHPPVIYQEDHGTRRAIDGGYVVHADGRVGFRVGRFDDRLALIIDPVLTYSTYLGGANQERVNDVAFDAQDALIIVGETYSSDFPVVNAFQPVRHGFGDVFVAKLTPAGDALVYATYLGGGSFEYARGVAADSAGSAYVVGETFSPDFPTKNALQPAIDGPSDVFVAKLDASGALVYSTFFGGTGEDNGTGIAVDVFGRAHVAGATISADFPIVAGPQPSLGGYPAFRSTDGGATWSGLNAGLKTIGARSFAFDTSTQPGTVYVGTEAEGVFKSADGGSTWTRALSANLPPVQIYALALGSGSPATLYAATHVGLFRSYDRGDSWADLHLWPTVTSVVLMPDSPSTIYAGLGWGSPQGVFRSTDGGQTWTETGLSDLVNGLAVSGSTVYAATTSGLYKSVAGGAWIFLNNGFSGEVAAVATSPNDADTAYVATLGGLFKTNTGGASWSPVFQLGGSPIAAIAVAPSDPSIVYVMTVWWGLAITHDGGETWQPGGPVNAQPYSLAVDPTATSTVYVSNSVAWDAFVATLSPDGSSLEYSTFLGGSNSDLATGIALGSDGAAYVVVKRIRTIFPFSMPFSRYMAASPTSSWRSSRGPERSITPRIWAGGTQTTQAESPSIPTVART